MTKFYLVLPSFFLAGPGNGLLDCCVLFEFNGNINGRFGFILRCRSLNRFSVWEMIISSKRNGKLKEIRAKRRDHLDDRLPVKRVTFFFFRCSFYFGRALFSFFQSTF